MGSIKKRNRTLPLHQEPHIEGMPDMVFFEQIIRDEVKNEVQKAVHDAQAHQDVYYYPDGTSDLSERLHHVK